MLYCHFIPHLEACTITSAASSANIHISNARSQEGEGRASAPVTLAVHSLICVSNFQPPKYADVDV